MVHSLLKEMPCFSAGRYILEETALCLGKKSVQDLLEVVRRNWKRLEEVYRVAETDNREVMT